MNDFGACGSDTPALADTAGTVERASSVNSRRRVGLRGACEHDCRLKTLRGLTPTEFILNAWTKEPDRFKIDPSHLSPGPYI